MGPVLKRRTVHVSGNQWKVATFGNLGPMQFAVRTTIKVIVAVKVGDVRQSGAFVYPAIFALG